MQSIPLGRVNVPSAGTPVPVSLTAAQAAMLSAAGQCAKVEVWPDPANTGTIDCKAGRGIIAPIPKPANGYAASWCTPECDGNRINPLVFSLDAGTNGDGGYVTLWVA